MLGGLFGSKEVVDPTTVRAHATETDHGPFPVSIYLEEAVENGVRGIKAVYSTTTTKGYVEADTADDLLTAAEDAYKGRLAQKNAENAAARSSAIAANAAAKTARAEANAKAAAAKAAAEAKALQDKADSEERTKILDYLKERRIKTTTGLLSKKISENDKKRYNIEVYRNSTVKPPGPNPHAGEAAPVQVFPTELAKEPMTGITKGSIPPPPKPMGGLVSQPPSPMMPGSTFGSRPPPRIGTGNYAPYAPKKGGRSRSRKNRNRKNKSRRNRH
jgi:hypothetical protein